MTNNNIKNNLGIIFLIYSNLTYYFFIISALNLYFIYYLYEFLFKIMFRIKFIYYINIIIDFFKNNISNYIYISRKPVLPVRARRSFLNGRISKYLGINNCRYYSTKLINYNNNLILELFNKNDCFYIVIFKSNKHKLGEGVSLNLVINSLDESLLNELSNIIGNSGKIVARNNYYCLTVKDFKSICGIVIPFLENEIPSLNENKQKAFKHWKEAANLINMGAHTTLEGLNEIKKIKLLMSNFEIKEGLSLVPFGTNLSSTVGYLKFSNLERNLIKIPLKKRSVFIGIILSDAALQKVNDNGDARLQFKQKYSQFEYLYFVYFQLSHYCSKGPVVNKVLLQKNIFYALSFTTRSLPCITELYNLFYPEDKKIIPHNIFDLLTWEALAHLIQGDGTYSSGITLQTQSFTLKDVVLLVNTLIIKFQLECTIHIQDKYNVIYIKSKSIKKNLHNLLPYVHPTMVYKFKGPQYKLKSKFTINK